MLLDENLRPKSLMMCSDLRKSKDFVSPLSLARETDKACNCNDQCRAGSNGLSFRFTEPSQVLPPFQRFHAIEPKLWLCASNCPLPESLRRFNVLRVRMSMCLSEAYAFAPPEAAASPEFLDHARLLRQRHTRSQLSYQSLHTS